jgi:uncharacterized protein (DUF2147 family)
MQKRLSIGAAMLLLATASTAHAADPTGTWRMTNGKVTLRVSECGNELCGRIVGLSKPLDKNGRPKRDKDNPNPALRDRPVVGLSLLRNMRQIGENRWEGRIYNPDDGRTYNAKVRLNGSTLQVKGCVLMFCKSQKFVRLNRK